MYPQPTLSVTNEGQVQSFSERTPDVLRQNLQQLEGADVRQVLKPADARLDVMQQIRDAADTQRLVPIHLDGSDERRFLSVSTQQRDEDSVEYTITVELPSNAPNLNALPSLPPSSHSGILSLDRLVVELEARAGTPDFLDPLDDFLNARGSGIWLADEMPSLHALLDEHRQIGPIAETITRRLPGVLSSSSYWNQLSDDTRKAARSYLADHVPVVVTSRDAACRDGEGPSGPFVALHDAAWEAEDGAPVLLCLPLMSRQKHVGALLVEDPELGEAVTSGLLRNVSSAFVLALQTHMQRQLIRLLGERHRRLVEKGQHIAFELDENGTILYISSAITPLTGYDPSELIGRSFLDLIHSDLDDQPSALLPSEDAAFRDIAIRTRDDGVVHLRVSLRVEQNRSGACIISGSALNVTEQRKTQNALLESVERNAAFARELKTLVRVSRGLETHLDSTVVAGRVVAGARDVLPQASRASLWLLHEEMAHLVASDAAGRGASIHMDVPIRSPENRMRKARPLRIPLSEGPFSLAYHDLDGCNLTRGRGETVSELSHPYFDGTGALMSAPIITSEDVIGVLVVEAAAAPPPFLDRHHSLLKSLAVQAAVSINNARAIEELRLMSQKLFQAQEEERRRVAQELHDETGGLLTALQFKLEEAFVNLRPSGDAAPSPSSQGVMPQLEGIQEITEMLSDVLRRVSQSLRPRLLDDIGLSAALPWLVRKTQERTGLAISLDSEIEPGARYDPLVETAVFRIAQEALTNIVRYADADGANIQVQCRQQTIQLRIADNGCGFDVDAWKRDSTSTLGLHGMTERAERLGGSLTIASERGKGTTIYATLPTEQDVRQTS